MNPNIAQCGTYSGYKKHLRERTQPCEPCKSSNNAVRRVRRYQKVHVVKVDHGPRLAAWDFRPGPWAQQAACADADPELFFADHPRVQAQALEFCRRCTVQAECLAEALRTCSDGIWGGLSPEQMDRLRKASA